MHELTCRKEADQPCLKPWPKERALFTALCHEASASLLLPVVSSLRPFQSWSPSHRRLPDGTWLLFCPVSQRVLGHWLAGILSEALLVDFASASLGRSRMAGRSSRRFSPSMPCFLPTSLTWRITARGKTWCISPQCGEFCLLLQSSFARMVVQESFSFIKRLCTPGLSGERRRCFEKIVTGKKASKRL